MARDIPVIVLTGGPCGGKTTALQRIPEKLSEYGVSCLVVPETPTELFSAGVTIGGNGLSAKQFQKQIFLAQIEKEDRFRKIIKHMHGGKLVLFCDRGTMDGRAYMDPAEFNAMAETLGYSVPQLWDRYASVNHLVTAAIGAEKFYTLDTNKCRVEDTLEKAALADMKTRAAWVGHPHVRLIDNSTDFEGKLKRLLASICRVVGIPVPLEIERKFLVHNPVLDQLLVRSDIHIAEIDIEQIYLTADGKFGRRVRKRGQNGRDVYYLTKKYDVEPSVRIELERGITPLQYYYFVRDECDVSRETIRKKRYCFLWNSQYFELDVFLEPARLCGLTLLEIELTDKNDRIDIPGFMGTVTDVTEDPAFTNRVLAKRR